MKRRHFLKCASSSALASSALPFLPGTASAAVEPAEVQVIDGTGGPTIDIHQHVNFHARTNDALVAHQRRMGVGKTILLPAGMETSRASTHMGKSNGLAARVFGTAAAAKLAMQYPDEFIWFCNEVSDIDNAKTELEKWLNRGASGIGEQKFALDCDSAQMQVVYQIARDFEVPVLIHFQHNKYNLGFERFHKMLEKYPGVNFFGHAQTWWGNVDANHKQEEMYPKTKVTPGGLTDKYLADYPNMFADMSAGSGQNAFTRDLDHAAEFIVRHQDKLCYGTDCADPEGHGDKCSGAGTRDVILKLTDDPKIREKIFRGNAKKSIPALADA